MHRVHQPWRASPPRTPEYRPILRKSLDDIPQIRDLDEDSRVTLKAVSAVFPFRVNSYVLDRLIEWDRVPEDSIWQLTFPQRGMLSEEDFATMAGLIRRSAPLSEVQAAAGRIQLAHNPHPAGQMQLNVPIVDGERMPGMQHKYRETVLFFPSQGQTCHAYCSYCFRWPQFVGIHELKFASNQAKRLASYLRRHKEVTDVLFTGGDPLVMRTDKLEVYLRPLLRPELDHVFQIRIGTKAIGYWPYRFTQGEDADSLLRLFERCAEAGREVAIMAHVSHPRELETREAREAVRRLRGAGCVIRSQAPVIRHVNDDPDTWAENWTAQLRLGIIPYYLFVERDTGPKRYFRVPLARTLEIYRAAVQRLGGLGRTVRGPSMSAEPGKVCVEGVAEVAGEQVFVLTLLQGRDPEWIKRPFFARFDPEAAWLDDLQPAFGRREFFFERALAAMKAGAGAASRPGSSLRSVRDSSR